MGNWNSGGGGGSAGDFDDSYNDAMGYSGGSSSSSDNENDNDGFFSGTFDDPGEPGFSGPTYDGQYGTDSEGTTWTFDDMAHSDWYESDKWDTALDKIDKIQNTGFNFNKDYAVMGAFGDVRGFDPRGGRYDADDAAFFSRAIGEYGIAGDIYSTVDRSTGFVATVRRGFEGLANGIAERFGTSLTRDYTVIPGQGYVGEVFEDYSGTDAIGNLLGMFVPGGGRVDRYMSRELTNTGKGAMAFGEAKAFYGAIDTQYAMTPAEEQAMMAEQRAADDAERARGGNDPTTIVSSTVTGTVTRPGSAIIGSLLGDTANPAYNIVAPYATDAFSYFTGGVRDYLGFAEGGEVPGAQMGGGAEPVTGPLGFVGGPPEQMSDAETVADDVPVEVQEGAYVLNAAAVEYMGSADVKNMILNAMQELKAQGVDKAQDVDKIELDTQVSLLVSKGEVLIPPQVAEVIGYDRLEKINKRGLRETQKRVEENGQSPEAEALDQQPANPAEGMKMAPGGEVQDNSKPEYFAQPLDDRVKQMDESLDRKFVLFDVALDNLQKLYNQKVLKTPEELNEYYNKAREDYQKRVQGEQKFDPEAFDVIKDRQEQKYVGLLNKYAFSDKPLPGDEEIADHATMITTLPFGSDNNEVLPSMYPQERTYGFTMPKVGAQESFIAAGARTNSDESRADLSLEEIGMHEAFHNLTNSQAFADRTGRRFGSELTARSIDYVRALAKGDTENSEKIANEVKSASRMSRYQMLQLGIDVIASLYEAGVYDKNRALSDKAKSVLAKAREVDREFQKLQEPPSEADAYTGATVSANPSIVFDDPLFLDIYLKRTGPEEIQDLLSIIPFSKRSVSPDDPNDSRYQLDAQAIEGKEDGGKVESFLYDEKKLQEDLVKQGQPKEVQIQDTPDQSFISAEGEGGTGKRASRAQVSGEAGKRNTRTGEGFAVRPRVNYNKQKRTQEFPDGVVVDEKGKNIGFALEGQMFLSNDKSLRAGIEQQKSKSNVDVNLPAEYGGETIKFGSGSTMKRYNMGATFGPVDIDVSKTQVPQGEDVLGGSVRYRFSKDGDVTLEATDDGRSGRIGLNYRF